jgi:hypothetical protein
LDVLVVQRLLLGSTSRYPERKKLNPDGYCGKKTEIQIELFQQNILGYKHPDIRVDSNGKTHKKLISSVSSDFMKKHKDAALRNQVDTINCNHFLKLYKNQFPNKCATNELEKLLIECVRDPNITDIRWIAYMLATVKRECGGTWKPIEEWGKGKGKAYDVAIDVTDPVSSTIKKNVYYGRGYVQLTWDYNYKKVGLELGLGNDLYINPENALKYKTAYNIMSHGMRKGIFANAQLSQFLSGASSNYVGARRIINGQDHAQEIAADAVVFEELLKASRVSSSLGELFFSNNLALA